MEQPKRYGILRASMGFGVGCKWLQHLQLFILFRYVLDTIGDLFWLNSVLFKPFDQSID
jgi:hypothetical protein